MDATVRFKNRSDAAESVLRGCICLRQDGDHLLSTKQPYEESVLVPCDRQENTRADMRLREQPANLGYMLSPHLDSVQQPDSAWEGRFHRGAFDSRLKLLRPGVGKRGSVHPLVGTWWENTGDTKQETNRLWKWDVAEAFVGSQANDSRRYREFEVSPQGV